MCEAVPVRLRLSAPPAGGLPPGPWATRPVLVVRPAGCEVLASARSVEAAARWALAVGAVPVSPPALRARVASCAERAWLACAQV